MNRKIISEIIVSISVIIGISLQITNVYARTCGGHAVCDEGASVRNAGIYGEVNCNENEKGYQDGIYLMCCTPYHMEGGKDSGECVCTVPNCPSGYTSDSSATKCAADSTKTQSCNGTDKCGSCKKEVACYPLETNTKPNRPDSISIIIDGIPYKLSTDPDNPTTIKLPLKDSTNVKITVPTFVAPTTSSGGGYYFQASNYGVNNEWIGFNCTNNEDFCTDGGNNNTINFVPNSLPIANVLKENASGKISGMYYTIDKCDTNKIYSLPVEGYYVVDTQPKIVADCSVINNTLPDAGKLKTSKGCSSSTYTGKEINNSLHFNVGITDANGIDDIQGIIVWFTKNSSLPQIVSVNGSIPKIDIAKDIGIFIRKNGNSWDTPLLYGYDSSGYWKRSLDGSILNKSSEQSITQDEIKVTLDGSILTFDIKLHFNSLSTNPEDEYTMYMEGVDQYMINSNDVDQSRISQCITWGFDLGDPAVTAFSRTLKDATNTYIQWGVTDNETSNLTTIINAYRVGGLNTDYVQLFNPTNHSLGKFMPPTKPIDANGIGKFDDTYSWIFSNNTGEKDTLDIGNNENGKIETYITTYDKGCNYSTQDEKIDLNSWLSSRGGSIYSYGSIIQTAKDVSQSSTLGTFKNSLITKDNIDLGTEVIATAGQTISSLIHPEIGASLGTSIYDSNISKNFWFGSLVSKFNKQNSNNSIVEFNVPGLKLTSRTSQYCQDANCYIYAKGEGQTADIRIESGYKCDRNTLIISNNDIYIYPNLTSDDTRLSGCIFLAKHNIYIEDGTYQSLGHSSPQYDYLEGFLIADNQIIFSLVDNDKIIRDGIEISGGLVAFGSNDGKAIVLNRNLRLYSQTNPTVVQSYNNKFASISQIFFGSEAPVYKQEVGFKAF